MEAESPAVQLEEAGRRGDGAEDGGARCATCSCHAAIAAAEPRTYGRGRARVYGAFPARRYTRALGAVGGTDRPGHRYWAGRDKSPFRTFIAVPSG